MTKQRLLVSTFASLLMLTPVGAQAQLFGPSDEEKARAKERIFSFRDEFGQWDPKNQRPELWNLYNARKNKGESIRVFPISNWTELDIWQYIHLNDVPIVPLYFAQPRPTVERDGMLLMVDDDRFPLQPGEEPVMRSIRSVTTSALPLRIALKRSESGTRHSRCCQGM